MLRTDRSYNTVLRVDKIAYLLNIADLFSTHFNNEYLTVGLQVLPDRSDNAHWRVETAGGYRHIVFLR